MQNQFARTELLLGQQNMERLRRAKVAVFGIGGVGGYVVEALARSGVGAFVLVDSDRVDVTNINRQIIATHKTVGQYKTDVMRERILDINPEAVVEVRRCFYLPENADTFDFPEYSYVVDAVDTVTAKIEIILRAQAAGVPVISSMGAGNKLDPTAFHVADIYKTSMCPLAKVMRHELKKRGVKKLKVVYSTEKARQPLATKGITDGGNVLETKGIASGETSRPENERIVTGEAKQSKIADVVAEETKQPGVENGIANGIADNPIQKEAHFGTARRSTPGSVAFVPSVAGLVIASEIVKDLCEK